MLELKIDCRERALINLFTTIDIKIESLEIGDIQICETSEDGNTEILLVYERKTIADLDSSIKDGRYHEQKSRLVSNVQRNRICYILEGDIRAASKRTDTDAVFGAVINTMYRDKIFVYRSFDLNDTYQIIRNIWERINKDKKKWNEYLNNKKIDECSEVDPKVYKLSSTKSKNVTKDVVFINSLNNIPGCSSKIAKVIQEEYITLKNLVNAFEESSDPEKMLKDLKIGTRKLGPVLATRIYEFIMLE